MTIIGTPLPPEAETNRAVMLAQREAIEAEARRIMAGGPQVARDRHVKRGKLLPRDRVAGLLDPGSPFLEVGLFAASGVYEDDIPSAGVIAGIGRVMGRDCMIVATTPL